jgi:hypothetical protein
VKVKTPKNSPIEVLYNAARSIVDNTRKVFVEHGKDASELRIPILMHGTDLRVTIEAGSKVAARNAIEEAQVKASGKPEPRVDMTVAVDNAKMYLSMYATDLMEESRRVEQGSAEWHRTRDTAQRCMDTVKALLEVERLL